MSLLSSNRCWWQFTNPDTMKTPKTAKPKTKHKRKLLERIRDDYEADKRPRHRKASACLAKHIQTQINRLDRKETCNK